MNKAKTVFRRAAFDIIAAEYEVVHSSKRQSFTWFVLADVCQVVKLRKEAFGKNLFLYFGKVPKAQKLFYKSLVT